MKNKEVEKEEPVKLRQRELANGNYTLYLDIYWKGQREYEYLNLYVKKSNKTADNEQNRQTLIHDCARHTHATLLLSHGVDIYTVPKLLGHKHVVSTERYAHMTDKLKIEAMKN